MIFEEGNEIQMADQIRYLLDHPDFARGIAATAQAYARANHTVAHMVADHVRIYRELESRGSTFSLRTGR
jgi:spore maturation protein CgeB